MSKRALRSSERSSEDGLTLQEARASREGQPTLLPLTLRARDFALLTVDLRPLFAELGIDAASLWRPWRRASLARSIELAQRASEHLGGGTAGQERLESLVSAQLGMNPSARALCNVAGVRALYIALYRAVLRPRWRPAVRSGEVLRSGQFKVALELPGGAEPLLAVIRGLLRGLPRMVGCVDARIETSRSGAATLVYVTPPAVRTLWLGAHTWLRALFGSKGMVDQVLEQQEKLVASYEQLRAAHDQLRRQSDALREIQARNAAVVENTAELILICDEHGRMTFANQTARRLLLDSVKRRAALSVFRYVHEEDRERARKVFQAAARSDRPQRAEFRLLHPQTRELMWLETSAQRFQAAGGALRVLITARDIGDRKRSEQRRQEDADRLEIEVRRRTHELQRANEELRELHTRLINAERMGAAQELAGSVAHAINNPLAALTGTVEMMLEGQTDPDPKLTRVLQLARRIRSVVGRTLQLSREGTLNFTLEDPGALLQEVHDEILERARTRGVELQLERGSALRGAYADRTLLRAALVAVAENAIDASPRGGVVRLQVSGGEGLQLVEFRVIDSGPGIPKAVRDRVFEPFYSTKAAGTGLGLAIARGIILGHEGRIQFSDAPGGGTLATVEIPLHTSGGYRPREPGIAVEP